MKTETQIAKENVEVYENPFPDGIEGNPWTDKIRSSVKIDIKETCKTHKASCQRFMEFLEETFGKDLDIEEEFDTIIHKKTIDLKQAIKLYDEAGI